MKIINKLKESDCICITPNAYKKKLLYQLMKEESFYHIEFMTKEELQKKLFYEYKADALWKFSKKFNVIPEIGKILLNAMYTLENEVQEKNLYQKKEWLKKEGLLLYHPAFINSLKQKKIIIYGYHLYEMKPFDIFLKKYTDVEYIVEEEKDYLPEITEYETLENEVVGVAEKISKLLQNGISINHIYVGLMSHDYDSVFSKIFYQFHIPFERKCQHNLFEYSMVQTFLKMIPWNETLSKLLEVLEELEKQYSKEIDFYKKIYDKIILIFNQYYDENILFEDIREILIYDLKHTTIQNETYKNVVREVDFKNTLFEEEDYIFLLGANLGEFPRIYEDTDYFTDLQKSQFSLPTSIEKTNGEEAKIKQKISSYPRIFISYKKKTPFREYLPSTFIEEYKENKNIVIKKGKYHYSNHTYNTYLLNVSLDDFINFNLKNEHLLKLYGLEKLYYNTYDNQFTKISLSEFYKYHPYLLLSYTGMQKLFECPFKYYLTSILKINPPYEETSSLMLGNLFHAILERYFKNKDKIDEIIEEEFNKIKINQKEKQDFYFEKYQKEIKRLINLMEEQMAKSTFEASYFEEKIEWIEKKKITFCIFGKIDKIMTFSDEENSYIIVVDYKTGFASSDLSKIVYGMNMQLMLYLYLISKDKRFYNFRLGGAYIQSISSYIPNYTEGKTLEKLLWEQSKLDGFSLKRIDYIKNLDKDYANSSYVKGVRIKQDGEFYSSKRLLEESTLEKILELVKSKIEEAEQMIENAEFFINPKKFESEIGSSVSSCTYCSYRDICYRKAKNITTLIEYEELEFLGGEEN